MLTVNILDHTIEFSFLGKATGQPEVANFDIARRVNQKVRWLDVSMDDTCRVNEVESAELIV